MKRKYDRLEISSGQIVFADGSGTCPLVAYASIKSRAHMSRLFNTWLEEALLEKKARQAEWYAFRVMPAVRARLRAEKKAKPLAARSGVLQ